MRTRRSFTTALALALSLGAIGAPVTFGGSHAGALDRPTIVRVDDRGGFDWADAGIGAAGGSALSVLGLGLLLLVSGRQSKTKEESCVWSSSSRCSRR
jgi:hypothetical protein